jgi:hypothetical protein
MLKGNFNRELERGWDEVRRAGWQFGSSKVAIF